MDRVNTTLSSTYQELNAEDIKNKLIVALNVTSMTPLSALNVLLKQNPIDINSIVPKGKLLCHSKVISPHVGSNTAQYNVEVEESSSSVHANIVDDGNDVQSTSIVLFIPLASQPTVNYAHQQMCMRFGHTCCSFYDPVIHGTHAVIDRIAIRGDFIFGIHVTLPVIANNRIISNSNDRVSCCAFEKPGYIWPIHDEMTGQLKRTGIENLDANLVLHLLDLVMTHTSDPYDCFMAAYYAFTLADFLHPHPNFYKNKQGEEDYFTQLLKFGNDDMLLSLIVKAAVYLDHAIVTTANYFDLEMIVTLARQMNKEPLI